MPPLHRAVHGIGLYLQATGLGVSQGEAHVLAHLHAEGSSTISALHVAFAHRRSTLTSILDRLVAGGLVEREVHAEDRRSFLVSLTESGAKLAHKVHAALADIEADVARRVRPADLIGFAAVVEALQEAVTTGRNGEKS